MQSPSVSQSHAAPGPGAETLRFVHPTPPAPGHTIEIAPGILWARLALPFLLDHVNIYFVDDGKGWALIDTGLGDKATLAAWDPLLGTVLRDRSRALSPRPCRRGGLLAEAVQRAALHVGH